MKNFILNSVIATLSVMLWIPSVTLAETIDNGPAPDVWEWTSGSLELNQDETMTYHIGAWDENGISSIRFYVDGESKNVCYFMFSYDERECIREIKASDYPNGATLFVNALVKDSPGTQTWSTGITVVIHASPAQTDVTPDEPVVDQTTNQTSDTTNTQTGDTPPDAWEWLSPEVTELAQGETTSYFVGAWDENGVASIRFYIDGEYKSMCSYVFSYDNRECERVIKSTDYPEGATIYINALVKDSRGNQTWTIGKTITIQAATAETNMVTADNASPDSNTTSGDTPPDAWEWLSPEVNELSQNESTIYTVGAWDENGISSIRFYIDGDSKNVCYFIFSYDNQECTREIKAADYPDGATIFVNALVKDSRGNGTWTTGQTIVIHAAVNETIQNADGAIDSVTDINADDASGNAPSVWEWTWSSSMTTDASVINRYTVGAWDENGISNITIYVNGVAKRTCWYWHSYDNRECALDLKGSDYTAGTSLYVNARAKDFQGIETWTTGLTVTVQ